MMKIKYANYFALSLVAFLFIGSGGFATVSSGASCNLTNVTIAGGTLAATTETVSVTAAPSCWIGQVGFNRGNVGSNLITVTVTNGHSTGVITRIDTTQEVHPYANGPGIRGNNIIIPCSCSGTGLTGLSIAQTKSTATTVTISITATPSTWAGTVNIVNSAGKVLATASVPSSPGHATITSISGAATAQLVHAVFSGINSNTITVP